MTYHIQEFLVAGSLGQIVRDSQTKTIQILLEINTLMTKSIHSPTFLPTVNLEDAFHFLKSQKIDVFNNLLDEVVDSKSQDNYAALLSDTERKKLKLKEKSRITLLLKLTILYYCG